MNTKLYTILAILSAAALLTVSCAKETDESSESVQRRILEAWIEKYHPDATLLESGNYLLDSIPGTGRQPVDTSYVLVSYSVTYLDGTYTSYTYDSLAKQLGDYTPSGYYYPRIWNMQTVSSGLFEILQMMKEGGSLTAVITATQLNEDSGYYISSGDGSSKIYNIELHEVIDDIDQYQYEQMKDFADKYYPGIDSLEYGFFFKKTLENTEDTLSNEESINIWYIGRYLDMQVFDTNIEDTAKCYRIYSSSNSYTTTSYTHYDEEEDAISNSDFVQGFTKAVNKMVHGEKAVTFFYHELGYGSTGSGDIPGYIPLFFEIWVEEEDED